MEINMIAVGGRYIKNTEDISVENKAENDAPQNETEKGVAGEGNRDTFVRSRLRETTETVDYRPLKKLNGGQIQALKDERIESMKKMITEMLGKQALKAKTAQGQQSGAASNPNAWMSEFLGPQDTPETAANAISKDGEWGVNAVATRLVDMAISLAGGDASKVSELRTAVQAGFKAAEKVLGGVLPGVCQETYAETMKRFDYWEQHGSMDGYIMQQ